jgi:hypothetical protein
MTDHTVIFRVTAGQAAALLVNISRVSRCAAWRWDFIMALSKPPKVAQACSSRAARARLCAIMSG